MRLHKIIIVMLIISMTVSTAQGLLVTAEADGYSEGADISKAFIGMTLSSVGTYSELDGHVYSRTSDFASTGISVFGNNLSGTDIQGTPSNQLWYQSSTRTSAFRLRVDFDNAANYVAIDFITNNSSDHGILEAYNSMGILLSSIIAVSYGPPQEVQITRPTFEIAYIIASGINGETLCLDNFQANVIPEPSTFLLLGLGAFILRKRR